MLKLRHSSAMLHSCFSHSTTNTRRCSMTELSFQGTDPPQVPHGRCHPCARSSLSPMSSVCTGPGPSRPWGERPQSFDLKIRVKKSEKTALCLHALESLHVEHE